jgi:hypothetical protein
MAQNLDHLFGMKDLRSCPVIAMHVVMATRLSIVFNRVERDPLPDLAVRLRSMSAAQAIESMVRMINDLWPEPFAIHRPCCMMLTPDEALLTQVVTAAARGNRPKAMEAMVDMLPPVAREQLFQQALEAVGAIEAVRAQESRTA